MTTLSIDFETRSTVELRDTGVYPYAAHPDTDIWCMAWAFDGEEPDIWTPPGMEHDPYGLPEKVSRHIMSGGAVRAHNAQFERVIWREIMVPRYGAPPIANEQWYDSAAEAAAMALPRSLAALGSALGSPQQKDDAGHRLMMRMSKPRRIEEDGTIIWWDEESKLDKLYEYCKQDVRTEMALSKFLRPLDPQEREVFLLDATINDRGVRADRALINAAKGIVVEGTRRANEHIAHITGGAVLTITNAGALRKWLGENGVETDSVDKAAVADMLADELLPEKVRYALQVRVDSARSSVAKLDSMLAYAGADDRMRGMLLYHGATTGRWSGKGPQPQNYPRGTVDHAEDYIPIIMDGDYEKLNTFEHPLGVVSSLLRACLISGDGWDIIAADLSAIEARVLNVLAGQSDIVDMFKRGVDVYKHNATRLFGVGYADVTKFQRQTGKFQELGCGFGMGAKKAVAAGNTPMYGLSLNEESAKAIVDNYRATHAHVVAFWYETEQACISAIENPGVPFDFGSNGMLRVFVSGAYMYLRLPSKRVLMYPAPSVKPALTPWGKEKKTVHFMGVDGFNNQWGEMRTYGGMLVENITQAVARDVIAQAMSRLEKAGYLVILSVHDEIVCEVPEGVGDMEEFLTIMCTGEPWTHEFPITAEGWRAKRYRK